MGGKVLLIGDALTGFRPHTNASTSQAAYDALVLADLVSGKITHDEYVKETMQFSRLIQDRPVKTRLGASFERVYRWRHILQIGISLSKPRQEEVYPEWTKV